MYPKFRTNHSVRQLDMRKYLRALESEESTLSNDLKELLHLLRDDDIVVLKSTSDPVQPYESDAEAWLSVSEVAELFSVSDAAVYKWIKNKKIDFIEPPVEGGKGYKIPKKQFEGKMLNRKQTQSSHQKHILHDATDIQLQDRGDLFRS